MQRQSEQSARTSSAQCQSGASFFNAITNTEKQAFNRSLDKAFFNSEPLAIQKKKAIVREKQGDVKPIQSKVLPSVTTKLPIGLQAKAEQVLDADLSDVKISESLKAKEIGALAYTQGNEIIFAPGLYQPETAEGQKLIGHELAHVKQQQKGRVKPTTQAKGLAINDDVGLEMEADHLGRAVAQAKIPEKKTTAKDLRRKPKGNEVAQFALPAVIAAMGAAEWIAAGALGYQVAQSVVNESSGDVNYTFDEVDGVLLPGGGNDVAAHKTAHPNAQIYRARHEFAIWRGMPDTRKMGIKFGINFLYDDAGAIGNISLSILDVYDWPSWGGSVNVNITSLSLASGNASFRFTINVGDNNTWGHSENPGSVILSLRGGDGDLSFVRDDFYGFEEIT